MSAQPLDPVAWKLEAAAGKAAPGSVLTLWLKASIDPGWHLYSMTTPAGGAPPTTIKLAENPALGRVQIFQPKPVRKFDPNFQVDTETFEIEAKFLIHVEILKSAAAGPLEIVAQVKYNTCDDRQCLPPKRKQAAATVTVDAGAPVLPAAASAGYEEAGKPGAPEAAAAPTAPAAPAPARPQGLGAFLVVAFGFGLAAIFTPCVFPMIPITMSFFLNRQEEGRGGLSQAVVFCLGIIVLFTLLGLATTAILGPFGVVQLGSNPWVNGFIALVFFAFALSLLGAFEITIPSSVLTRMDRISQRGGYGGALFMGLTFSLTSFACVGPFVGTLLAASVKGGGLEPVFGMAAFASGLALPFFFLALFPSWLKKLPRSGGWLARVKVVLGFVILAAALKYAMNVDQVLQTNFLTRERFLAAWFVLFALPGLYLLGLIRLEGVKPEEHVGTARLLISVVFLAFALSLLPGMFGARLGELEAFIPEPSSGASPASAPAKAWMKNEYREALEKARAEGKRVFVSFTGYACSNCHWMKANMLPRPEIAAELGRFVLVELYTDGTDAASQDNQKLQESKFQTIAIPYYAILDADERVVASFAGLTRNPAEFLAFLKKG